MAQNQIDFSVIKRAFAKRFPDVELPETGMPMGDVPEQTTATQFAQQTAGGEMDTVPEGQMQEMNQVGGAKSESQKIVEALANRLKKLA